MKQIIHTTDWIVVYTKPRHEYSVLNDLSKIGFDSYIPTIEKEERGVIEKGG